jgi:acyl carrier protein
MQSTIETLEALVLEKLELQASSGPIDPDRSLFDVGLTSLQIVDLVFVIEDRLNLAIPDDEINSENFHSLSTILALIDGLQGGNRAGLFPLGPHG